MHDVFIAARLKILVVVVVYVQSETLMVTSYKILLIDVSLAFMAKSVCGLLIFLFESFNSTGIKLRDKNYYQ